MEVDRKYKREGMIIRLELTDFMGHSSFEIMPQPFLNILCAPNGTGKSTVVCAIVLGLGGKPKTLGKTAELNDYISNGKDTAKIKIELSSFKEHNYIVEREISKTKKSLWHLNGKIISLKELEGLMKSLNIQVNNLCQFLPQDKVQDFSKMNPQQLLENTIRTVGSLHLIDLHMKLVKMREKENKESEIGLSINKDLERESAILIRVENEAQVMRERIESIKGLKILCQKKAWILYEESHYDFKKLEEERDDLLSKKCKLVNDSKPIENYISKWRTKYLSTEKNMQTLKDVLRTVPYRMINRANQRTEHEESLYQIQRNYEEGKKRILDTKNKIKEIKWTISQYENLTLGSAEAQNKLEEEARELQQIIHHQNTEIESLEEQRTNYFCQVRAAENSLNRMGMMMDEIRNLDVKKLHNFSRLFPDAYNLMEWLKSNNTKFRGNIYGPIMMVITVDPQYVKFVEHLIPHRDLQAFVCEYNDDVTTLLKIGRDEKKLKINAVSAESIADFDRTPKTSIDVLRKLHFKLYVADTIQGPTPVLNYLCHSYNLHNIPIGPDSALERLQETHGDLVNSFFVGDSFHSRKISKYSRAQLSRIVHVQEAKLFQHSIDTIQLNDLNSEIESVKYLLQNNRNALENVTKLLETAEQQREKLKNDKRSIYSQMNTIKTNKTKLSMKYDELRREENSSVLRDPGEVERIYNEQKFKEILNIIMTTKGASDDHKQCLENLLESEKLRLMLILINGQIKKTEKKSSDMYTELENLETTLDAKNLKLTNIQKELNTVFEAACKETNGLSPKDKDFIIYEKKFERLPNTFEKLEVAIERSKAKIDCIGEGRKDVIHEYEKQKKKVENLRQECDALKNNMDKIKNAMDTVRMSWMSGILDLINDINEKYSEFFERMSCEGKVCLYTPNVENDFKDYGISIKVKFRNDGTLQELGPSQQSGGERAVSTGVYILALQHLTTVPFRCIDEINQGMDENNERIMYQLLREITEESDAAQTILITPKLLRKLETSPKCFTITIFNPSYSEGKLSDPMEDLIRFTKSFYKQQAKKSKKRKLSDENDN